MKKMFWMFLVLALFLPSVVWAEAEIKVSLKDSNATYDRVWSAAVSTLYELRLPIGFMSKEDGYIITENKATDVSSSWNALLAYRVRVTLRFLKTGEDTHIKIFSEKEGVSWDPPSRRIESSSIINPIRDLNTRNYVDTSSRIVNDNSTPFYFWVPIGSDEALENMIRNKIVSLI